MIRFYDIIGDIHGHYSLLEHLLDKLEYSYKGGQWVNNNRMLVFTGDLIDRGPDQRRVLDVVSSLVKSGNALCVMGNHELNAICYATERVDGDGGFLRQHSTSNIDSHRVFLDAFDGDREAYLYYINWMKTLPIFLDLGLFRVVHAAWHAPSINYLRSLLAPDNRILDSQWQILGNSDDPFTVSVETILKGPEIHLAPRDRFRDASGSLRSKGRLTWWPTSDNSIRSNVISTLEHKSALSDTLDVDVMNRFVYEDKVPVFFGHYWLDGEARLINPSLACLDFGAGKGRRLTAYRWSGEQTLLAENIVTT